MSNIGPWSCSYDCMESTKNHNPTEQDRCLEWKILTMRSKGENCINVIPMAWIQNRTVEVIQKMYSGGPREIYEELVKLGIFESDSGNEPFIHKLERNSTLVYIMSVLLMFVICMAMAYFFRIFVKRRTHQLHGYRTQTVTCKNNQEIAELV